MMAKKEYIVEAGGKEYPIRATSRRTALVGVLIELLRSGTVRMLNFNGESTGGWKVVRVAGGGAR